MRFLQSQIEPSTPGSRGIAAPPRIPSARSLLLRVILLAILAATSLQAQATRYHVATNGNDLADGLTWPTALQTIPAALAKTGDGDTIMLAYEYAPPDRGLLMQIR